MFPTKDKLRHLNIAINADGLFCHKAEESMILFSKIVILLLIYGTIENNYLNPVNYASAIID